MPALFDGAVASKLPAFAVAAGEVASKLDPAAAIKAFDARLPKLRDLAHANAVRFLGEIRDKETGSRLAAAAWFALSVLADVPIANYARSWEEWGNRPDTPIEV